MANAQSKWREYLWYYAPLVFWIIIVFVLSSNTGSMSNTSRIIRPLLVFLFPDITDASIASVQIYTRKTAHFVLYFVLGFLAARAFSSFAADFLRKKWFAAALFLVVLVAAIDEANQSFLASRTGSIYDVLLDAAGGATALLIFYFWHKKSGQANL